MRLEDEVFTDVDDTDDYDADENADIDPELAAIWGEDNNAEMVSMWDNLAQDAKLPPMTPISIEEQLEYNATINAWCNGVVAFFNTDEGKAELIDKFTNDPYFQINILKLSAMNATQSFNPFQRLTFLISDLNSQQGKEELKSMYDQDTEFMQSMYSLSCFTQTASPRLR